MRLNRRTRATRQKKKGDGEERTEMASSESGRKERGGCEQHRTSTWSRERWEDDERHGGLRDSVAAPETSGLAHRLVVQAMGVAERPGIRRELGRWNGPGASEATPSYASDSGLVVMPGDW
jgi:hypothetical protein